MTDSELIDLSLKARELAYAPYSKYRVGAVVVTEEGKLFTGANVENCVFPLGDCAERVAIYNAVSHGYKKFKKIVIGTGNKKRGAPCGMCRQVMREFCEDIEIIVASPDKSFKSYTLKEVLPHSYSPESLFEGQG